MRKLILIFILITLIGCKTKKKVTERTHEKKEIVSNIDTKKEEFKDVKKEGVVNSKTETLKITSNNDIELSQADPNKQIIVEDASGNKTVYTGANVIIRKSEIKESKKDTSTIKVSSSDKSIIINTDKSKSISKEGVKKRSSDSESKGLGFGYVLLIGIALLLFLIYRNRKTIFRLFGVPL
jgi:hypothetical protein